jgi:hypothetical protein
MSRKRKTRKPGKVRATETVRTSSAWDWVRSLLVDLGARLLIHLVRMSLAG